MEILKGGYVPWLRSTSDSDTEAKIVVHWTNCFLQHGLGQSAAVNLRAY